MLNCYHINVQISYMSFLAKLFLNGRELIVLDTNIRLYRQLHPSTFQPTTQPMGGIFNVTLEADGNTELLRLMLSPKAQCNGHIRFYKHDALSKLYDYEFFDTHVVGYRHNFDGVHGTSAQINVTFSPGILRIGDMVFEKHWKTTDLKAKDQLAAPPRKEEKKPKLYTGYFENEQTEKEFRPKKNDTVYYIAKTRDMTGKNIDIDLGDTPIVFEHEGQALKNGMICGLQVTGNRMRIPLKVLQKKK